MSCKDPKFRKIIHDAIKARRVISQMYLPPYVPKPKRKKA